VPDFTGGPDDDAGGGGGEGEGGVRAHGRGDGGEVVGEAVPDVVEGAGVEVSVAFYLSFG
jgi:hypothetical protein